MSALKNNIVKLANLHHLDIKGLERKAKLGNNFLYHIIQDKSTNPGIVSLVKLADALEVSLDELMGRKRKYLKQHFEELNVRNTELLAEILDYTASQLKKHPNIMVNFNDVCDFIYELLEYCKKDNKFDTTFATWLINKYFLEN
jgi:transcriptional regulator with XRE-family HTH domain